MMIVNANLKLKIITFAFSLFVSLSAKAQCILERIAITKGEGWQQVSDDIKRDSAFRVQEWIPQNQTVRNRTLLLRTASFEKTRPQMAMPSDSLFRWIQNSRIARRAGLTFTTTMEKVKTNADVRYAILPAGAKSGYGTNDLMTLLWYVNGKTTFHQLSIHTTKENFNASFIDKWTKIFEAALIIPPVKSSLRETVFAFGVKDGAELDSAAVADFRNAVNGRLEGLCQRFVSAEDIQLPAASDRTKTSSLYFTLYGDFDSARVIQALNRKMNASDFELLKGDTAVTAIRKQLAGLQKEGNNPPFLIFQSDNYYATSRTGEIAMLAQKDTLALKKLLSRIPIPATKTFCFVAENQSLPDDGMRSLFLIEKESLVNAGEISNCSLQFNEQGYPGIVFILNEAGKEKIATYSRQNIGRPLATAIKGKVKSMAVITSEIPNGRLFLAGRMTLDYANHFLDELGYPYPSSLQFVGIKSRQ